MAPAEPRPKRFALRERSERKAKRRPEFKRVILGRCGCRSELATSPRRRFGACCRGEEDRKDILPLIRPPLDVTPPTPWWVPGQRLISDLA